MQTTSAQEIVAAWPWIGAEVSRLSGGLINTSYVVCVAGVPVAVLQRLNTAVFDPAVHFDIEAVTARLTAHGLATPRLVRTVDGALFVQGPGGVWRALSWVGTRTLHKVHDVRDAECAAALVARVHGALADFDYAFRSVRAGPHDTVAHMARLQEAVAAHPAHRLAGRVRALAEEILERWDSWQGELDQPKRVIHGDLKISNVRFDADDALALVDLDTFQVGSLAAELGDAMRSWCNPASEDAPSAVFDLDVFAAAMRGDARGAAVSGRQPTEVEWDAIVPGTERIALELSARFLRDALEERYFGYDERFGGRGEHNLMRGEGQLDLARRVRESQDQARRLVDRARR